MILRRVIAHFRKQEWTAIAIDFVIVVLGVFVGLQVNDWGAAQAAKRRGHEYVERLIHDVERDLAGRRNLVAYYDAVHASAERANALLAQPSSDPAELVVNVYRATEYSYYTMSRATWDEIVSSGDLALLPRSAVEEGLSEYFSFDVALGAMNGLGASPYRHRVRSLIPHEVQSAIRQRCGDVRDQASNIIGFRPDCDLGLSREAIAAAARTLRQDPAVLGGLRYQFSDLYTARANLRGDVTILERALADLKEAAR